MSGGFFRGTSADQDTRFSNKQAKLLKSQKFAPELEHLVDMTKVKMDVIRPWIATRVTELLGFEDEVLIYFIYGLLEGKEADGKQIQIQLTGFMEKNTGKFMKELWGLLLSAQKNASGVPQQFLDAKEQELKKKQHDADIIGLEGRRRERGGWGPEPDKATKMDGKADTAEAGDGPRSVTAAAVSSAKQSSTEDGSPRSDDNVKMDRKRGSRRKSRHSTSAHSDDNSLSSNRRSPSATRSRSRSFSNSRSLSEERHRSHSVSVSPRHRRRPVSPERRYPSPKRHVSPRRAPRSPARRQSPQYRRRSTSRSRHRSPLVRHRSPLRRRSPNPRHRSPSPYRYGSPSPRHRYSPRRRSPVHIRRRSPSPRRSPIRRRTPPRHLSPPRRGSPPRSPRYHRRSPLPPAPKWSRSPHRSQSPQRPRRSPNRSPVPPSEKTGGLDIGYKRPDPSLRKQITAGSPSYRSREDNNVQNVASVKPTSPEKLKLPFRDRDRKSNGKRIHASSLSPDGHSKERRLLDGSDASEGEERAPRHYAKTKVDSSISNHLPLNPKSRMATEEMPQPPDVSHERQTLNQLEEGQVRSSHRNASSNAESQHERPTQCRSSSPQDVEYGPGIVGGGSLPSDPVYDSRSSAKRYSSEVGRRSHELKKPTNVSDVDDRTSTLKMEDNDNVHGSDKKTKRKVDQHDLGSNSEDGRAYKGPLAGRRSTNNHKDSSDESGYHSDSIDRKERKRRKKEEKKLRKEEKRRRREERHRRKEERRAAKHKSKHVDIEPASDDDQNHGHPDSEVEREGKPIETEDTESEQKKLEIRLREKALESLRAKKAITH